MTIHEFQLLTVWQDNRKLKPEDRLKELDRYEAELDAVRREMAPVRQAIERIR